MKHHAWLDRKRNLLWVRFIGFCGLADLAKLMEDCQGLIADKNICQAAIDLSGIECFPDEEVRSEMASCFHEMGISRVAIVSVKPQVKVVAVVLSKDFAVYAEARSFTRKDQALRWLKNADRKAKLTRESLQSEIV